MDQHPEIGDKILEPVPFLQEIRPIVRACHERWDGKGYPEGRAGEDIPLEARIVFVCDAFHAMTSDRPYRRALPEREMQYRTTPKDWAQVQVFYCPALSPPPPCAFLVLDPGPFSLAPASGGDGATTTLTWSKRA